MRTFFILWILNFLVCSALWADTLEVCPTCEYNTLTAAIADRLEEEGKSSFRHYFLPEAVLKFRQGVGRLIRRENDKGIVVVLDPRIIKNAYGKMFLDSIPESKQFIGYKIWKKSYLRS